MGLPAPSLDNAERHHRQHLQIWGGSATNTTCRSFVQHLMSGELDLHKVPWGHRAPQMPMRTRLVGQHKSESSSFPKLLMT